MIKRIALVLLLAAGTVHAVNPISVIVSNETGILGFNENATMLLSNTTAGYVLHGGGSGIVNPWTNSFNAGGFTLFDLGGISSTGNLIVGSITLGTNATITTWPSGGSGSAWLGLSNIVVGVGMTGGGTSAVVNVGIDSAYWDTVSNRTAAINGLHLGSAATNNYADFLPAGALTGYSPSNVLAAAWNANIATAINALGTFGDLSHSNATAFVSMLNSLYDGAGAAASARNGATNDVKAWVTAQNYLTSAPNPYLWTNVVNAGGYSLSNVTSIIGVSSLNLIGMPINLNGQAIGTLFAAPTITNGLATIAFATGLTNGLATLVGSVGSNLFLTAVPSTYSPSNVLAAAWAVDIAASTNTFTVTGGTLTVAGRSISITIPVVSGMTTQQVQGIVGATGSNQFYYTFQLNGVTVTNGGNYVNVGPVGPAGTNGLNGANGTNGTTPTIIFTNTITGAAGSSASVTNFGNSTNLNLQLTIPRGADGLNGTNGTNGSNGTNVITAIGWSIQTNAITVGSNITNLNVTTGAALTRTITSNSVGNVTMDLTINPSIIVTAGSPVSVISGAQSAGSANTNNAPITVTNAPPLTAAAIIAAGGQAGIITNQISLKYDGQLPNTTNDLNGISLDLNPTQATANQYIRNGISIYNAATNPMTNYVLFSFTYLKANATNINLGFYRSAYTGMVSNNFIAFNWTNRLSGASIYSGIFTVSVNAASTWTNTTLVVPAFTNLPVGATVQGWWYATPYSTNGASAVQWFTLESEAQIW